MNALKSSFRNKSIKLQKIKSSKLYVCSLMFNEQLNAMFEFELEIPRKTHRKVLSSSEKPIRGNIVPNDCTMSGHR